MYILSAFVLSLALAATQTQRVPGVPPSSVEVARQNRLNGGQEVAPNQSPPSTTTTTTSVETSQQPADQEQEQTSVDETEVNESVESSFEQASMEEAPGELPESVNARLHLVQVCPELARDCSVPTTQVAQIPDLQRALDCMLAVNLDDIEPGPCLDAMHSLQGVTARNEQSGEESEEMSYDYDYDYDYETVMEFSVPQMGNSQSFQSPGWRGPQGGNQNNFLQMMQMQQMMQQRGQQGGMQDPRMGMQGNSYSRMQGNPMMGMQGRNPMMMGMQGNPMQGGQPSGQQGGQQMNPMLFQLQLQQLQQQQLQQQQLQQQQQQQQMLQMQRLQQQKPQQQQSSQLQQQQMLQMQQQQMLQMQRLQQQKAQQQQSSQQQDSLPIHLQFMITHQPNSNSRSQSVDSMLGGESSMHGRHWDSSMHGGMPSWGMQGSSYGGMHGSGYGGMHGSGYGGMQGPRSGGQSSWSGMHSGMSFPIFGQSMPSQQRAGPQSRMISHSDQYDYDYAGILSLAEILRMFMFLNPFLHGSTQSISHQPSQSPFIHIDTRQVPQQNETVESSSFESSTEQASSESQQPVATQQTEHTEISQQQQGGKFRPPQQRFGQSGQDQNQNVEVARNTRSQDQTNKGQDTDVVTYRTSG